MYEIIGVTDDKSPYGESPERIFNSVRELLKEYNVDDLDELENLQLKNEPGYHFYLVVKDLETGNQGPYFYLNDGQWCRGSGAEPLYFGLLRKM